MKLFIRSLHGFEKNYDFSNNTYIYDIKKKILLEDSSIFDPDNIYCSQKSRLIIQGGTELDTFLKLSDYNLSDNIYLNFVGIIKSLYTPQSKPIPIQMQQSQSQSQSQLQSQSQMSGSNLKINFNNDSPNKIEFSVSLPKSGPTLVDSFTNTNEHTLKQIEKKIDYILELLQKQ